jgi:transposase
MSQVTLLTGPERRRRWSVAERETILAEAFGPGGVVADVARRFDIATSLIYRWRRDCLDKASAKFSPVVVTEPAQRRDLSPLDPAIMIEMGEVRVRISGSAPAALITATLRALR